MNRSYKQCGYCRKTWHSREDMVRDPDVRLLGFQAFFDQPAEGLLLFNHATAKCRTTIAVRAGDFEDWGALLPVPDNRTESVVCPGHCLSMESLEACSVPCELRWVRQVMQHLNRHEVPAVNPLAPQTMKRFRRTA